MKFTGERIVPGATNCEPKFAQKMYMEHSCRYMFAAQKVKGCRVLDVGCGVGYGSQILARHGAREVMAFDLSSEAIDFANRFYKTDQITFKVASAYDPEVTGQFDLITCFELIEHLERPVDLIINLKKLLAENGVLFLSSPRRLAAPRSAFHVHEYSPDELMTLMQSHFPAVRIWGQNNHLTSMIYEGPSELPSRHHLVSEPRTYQNSDYVLLACAREAKSLAAIEGHVAMNDDAYVLLLERDVGVLHTAEDRLKEQAGAQATDLRNVTQALDALRVENHGHKVAMESWQRQSQVLERQLDELRSSSSSLTESVAKVYSQISASAQDHAPAFEALITEVKGFGDRAQSTLARTEQAISEASGRLSMDSSANLRESFGLLLAAVNGLEAQTRAWQERFETALRQEIANSTAFARQAYEAVDAMGASLQKEFPGHFAELQTQLRNTFHAELAGNLTAIQRAIESIGALRPDLDQIIAKRIADLQEDFSAKVTKAISGGAVELSRLNESVKAMGTALAAEVTGRAVELRTTIGTRLEAGFTENSAILGRTVEAIDRQAAGIASQQEEGEKRIIAANAEKIGRLHEAMAKSEGVLRTDISGLLNVINFQRRADEASQAEISRLQKELVLARRQIGTLGNEASYLRRLALENHEAAQEAREKRTAADAQTEVLREEVKRISGELKATRSSLSWSVALPVRRLQKRWRKVFPVRSTLNAQIAASPAEIPAAEQPRLRRIPEDFETRSLPLKLDVLYIVGCLEGESKRYRVYNLVESYQRQGRAVAALYEIDIPRLLQLGLSADVVVIFRNADSHWLSPLFDYCNEHRIPVAFDVDDLVFEPEMIGYARAVALMSEHEREQYLHGVKRYRSTLERCGYVTVTTPILARHAAQLGKRADVIPNGLNYEQLDSAEHLYRSKNYWSDRCYIGYFSGTKTHEVDFAQCAAAIREVMEEFPHVHFLLVGHLTLGAEWARFSDRLHRLDYLPPKRMFEILAGVDINVAPLELDNPFTAAKSQLKIFEAGVLGVPTIASPVESYLEAIAHGSDGYFASTHVEWVAALRTLVTSPEQRHLVGIAARARALRQYHPEVIHAHALQVYKSLKHDLAVREAVAPRAVRRSLSITWIVPGILIGGGGHRNILRAAYHLERFGHAVKLYFTGVEYSDEEIRRIVHEHFYPINAPMTRYTGIVDPTEVAFATHWSTVDVLVRNRGAVKHPMYFVQDFEPAFAPMGSEYVLAEDTYRKGFYHITSGQWCATFLRKEFNADADAFTFPIDRETYHPRARKSDPARRRILFFAKPEMPRRCYELGVFALSRLVERDPTVEIVTFGSRSVTPDKLPFKAECLGILPTIDDLAQLYSDVDIGLVFSTTNPSLVPYEMMACGLPVVDLRREDAGANYGDRTDLAFLVDSYPETMADQILSLLNDPAQRSRRAKAGLEFTAGFPQEEQMARRVESLILARVQLET